MTKKSYIHYNTCNPVTLENPTFDTKLEAYEWAEKFMQEFTGKVIFLRCFKILESKYEPNKFIVAIRISMEKKNDNSIK